MLLAFTLAHERGAAGDDIGSERANILREWSPPAPRPSELNLSEVGRLRRVTPGGGARRSRRALPTLYRSTMRISQAMVT
jgi:hypothetical protein